MLKWCVYIGEITKSSLLLMFNLVSCKTVDLLLSPTAPKLGEAIQFGRGQHQFAKLVNCAAADGSTTTFVQYLTIIILMMCKCVFI